MNYDWFHKSPKIQKKIISRDNFTYRIILSILDKIIGNKKTLNILDYGCGVGTIDFYLASQGHKVTGLEISPSAIKICRKSAQAIGVRADFYSTNKKLTKKFDLVLCFEVIEHIPNNQKLINYLCALLKKNGILILSTPSKNAPLYKLGLAKSFDQRVGHLRRYNSQELIDLTKKLQTKQIIKTEGILRNSLFVSSSLGNLIRFIKGPFSDLVTFFDNLTIPLSGESDLILIAKKV